MKHFTIALLTLITGILNQQTHAQTNIYQPYPQGWGAMWTYESAYSSTQQIDRTKIFWGEELIVNSLKYKKVNQQIGIQNTYIGAVREVPQDEKVYFLTTNNVEIDISFNQRAQIGDTIKTKLLKTSLYNSLSSDDTVFVVEKTDSIKIDNKYRKTFDLLPVQQEGNHILKYFFICGIGFTGIQAFEYGWGMQCFAYESNLQWGNPINPACYLGKEELYEISEFRIHPNPTKGLSTYNKPITSMRIFGIDGKEVQATMLDFQEKTIDISNLPAGIYNLEFHFENQTSFQKIVKM